MKYLMVLAALPGALWAQSLEGTWQGAIKLANQNRQVRVAFKITKDGNGLQGVAYNLEAGGQLTLGAITLQGNAVKIMVPGMGGTYEGKFELDGDSITGALTQGANSLRLPLKRATAATAWELPPPPAAPKPLPEGTKLEFEVASIKPSGAGEPGNPGFNVTATELRSQNISLAGIITFAFELHSTQVIGLPRWAETDGYAITAKLPPGGDPTDGQLRAMLQSLLQGRFGLSFHKETRELPVYVINIGKDGPAGIKMATSSRNGPNMGSQGVGRVSFRGLTMADLANQLQLRVLDRPVIDRSGLSGRYDFSLDWRPDEFQFPRFSAAQRAAAVAANEALPDLFTAFQQQLGMKLEAIKAPADVLVIDNLSRPSEN